MAKNEAQEIITHEFGLPRGVGAFFCPDSNLHLIAGHHPRGTYPAGQPLSPSVKRAIRGGGLIDINGTVTEELLSGRVGPTALSDPGANVLVLKPETQPVAAQTNLNAEVANTNKPLLSEMDIDNSEKAELLTYCKEHGIEFTKFQSAEGKPVTTRSELKDIQFAIKQHYGYIKLD